MAETKGEAAPTQPGASGVLDWVADELRPSGGRMLAAEPEGARAAHAAELDEIRERLDAAEREVDALRASPPQLPAGAANSEETGAWGWGVGPEQIDWCEDTREAAIEAARDGADDGATVYVWHPVRDEDPGDYVPDVDDLLDKMADRAYHDCPWVESEWLELDALLGQIRAWARRHLRTWYVCDNEPEAVPPDGGAS